jgi:SAM-dependent methyltransferase
MTPKEFYTKLTAEGLAKRKDENMQEKEFSDLKQFLDKKQRILDLGCGYGRFAIPLAKEGYNVKGIDITPALIKKAKLESKKTNIKIEFRIGDMRGLPYKNETFDAIICMWSVFMELNKETEQLKAIIEMLRVLSKKGFALIEMPVPYQNKKEIDIVKYEKDNDEIIFKKNNPIVTGKFSGIAIMPSYRHDKNTLSNLMKKIKIKKFKISIIKFGGRNRLFLQFWKN